MDRRRVRYEGEENEPALDDDLLLDDEIFDRGHERYIQPAPPNPAQHQGQQRMYVDDVLENWNWQRRHEDEYAHAPAAAPGRPPQQQQQPQRQQQRPQQQPQLLQRPPAVANARQPQQNVNLYRNGRLLTLTRWICVIHMYDGQIIPGLPIGANNNPPEGISFIAGQIERGGNSENYHWQLYIECDGRMSASAIKSAFGWGANVHCFFKEPFGTPRTNIQYVTKNETYVDEYLQENGQVLHNSKFQAGRVHNPSATGGFSAVLDDMKDGMSWKELNSKYPSEFVRFHAGLRKQYEIINPPPARDKVECFLFWGPTGTGKTHAVMAMNDSEDVCVKMNGNQWFDGYDCQPILLFDEFTGEKSGITIEEMLRITDKWPLRANIKGGSVAARWTKVFFTSNVPFERWYPNAPPAQVEALARRIPPQNRIYMGTKFSAVQDNESENESDFGDCDGF